MHETLVWFLGREDLLEKDYPTHSSISELPLWLSWLRICLQCSRPGFDPWVGKIPCRRERLPTPVFGPGEFHGLQFMGSQRVRHDWTTFTLSWSGEFRWLYSPWGCKELDMTERLSLSNFSRSLWFSISYVVYYPLWVNYWVCCELRLNTCNFRSVPFPMEIPWHLGWKSHTFVGLFLDCLSSIDPCVSLSCCLDYYIL